MKQLKAQSLTIAQANHRLILNDINLSINSGEVIALLGANGAGKSTLSTCLAGDIHSLPSVSGEVFINDVAINTLSSQALAKQRAVLTQYPSLNFALSVHEVIEMGAYPFPELSSTETASLIQQSIDWMDITYLQHRQYQELSGGEKQRVQFARILVQLFARYQATDNPRYCLLDEPTSSLDPKNQQLLLKVLRRLAHELHLGVLVVLHDVNLAALHCDKLILLANGKIIAQGAPEQVLNAQNLETLYGIKGQTIAHPFVEGKVLVVWS